MEIQSKRALPNEIDIPDRVLAKTKLKLWANFAIISIWRTRNYSIRTESGKILCQVLPSSRSLLAGRGRQGPNTLCLSSRSLPCSP